MLNRYNTLKELDLLQEMLAEYEKLFPELCDAKEVEQFELRLGKSATDLTDDDVRKIDQVAAEASA